MHDTKQDAECMNVFFLNNKQTNRAKMWIQFYKNTFYISLT